MHNFTKRIKRATASILMLMILFISVQPVMAAQEGKVINVGFFAFDGYHNIDDDGCRSGYGYDFIQELLKYNNFTAKYVGYDKNWSQMQEMLENGEIDILTSAQKTPEREEKFDFSKPIGTSAVILTVKAGNEKIISGEYSTYNGMKVGVIEGNSRNDRFVEYAASKGFTYELVYYNDMDSLTNDLQNTDKIDAIVTSNLRSINNEWIIDKFNASPFYAMVKKGNMELLNAINFSIDQMDANSIGWKDELFDKYYSGNNTNSIAFTSSERDFLSELRKGEPINILVNPDRAPYSYIEDGEVKGIIPDIFQEVAKRLDISYKYIECDSRDKFEQLKNDKTADVVIDARFEPSQAEDAGYKLTDAYMNIAYATLEKSEFSGNIDSVAMLKLSYTSDANIEEFISNKKVRYYDTVEQCVNSVLDGKADVCYLYNYSAQKYSTENIDGTLQSTTLPDMSDSLAFAVRDDFDYRLISVLNKAVNSIKDNYVDTAIKNNTDFSIGEMNIFQILWRNPILIVVGITLISIVVILIIYLSQKNKNEMLQQKKNKELERFIGYVCKLNTSVIEVDFKGGKAWEYVLKDGHVEYEENKYEDIDKMFDNINIDKIINSNEDMYLEQRINNGADTRWYAITLAGIPVDNEHPKSVIIFKRDINEIKIKEEEYKKSLKDALNTANQASESKGNFLSNMSHEIRTPLNAIIGYITLAKDESISRDKLNHCIENCDVASRHLLQIINDILDMSSIESGKLKIAHEEFDLKKEISDITTIFFQNAKSKRVNFETHINNLVDEWVIGDQLRLNQVLMNLLSNAVKFTPANGLVKLDIWPNGT